MFKQYLHIEKFGNEAVEGIELGKVFVFPKLDGTNASVWMNNTFRGYPSGEGEPYLGAGSRTRELSIEKDNAGFYHWITTAWGETDPWYGFLDKNPTLRLYGEWLVPHSFKGYRAEAWRQFYVFDVFNDETEQYLSYDAYKPLLDEFGITYIPPLAIIKNGDYGRFLEHLSKNFFMIPDGGEPGEGIVLKNYDFQNKFGQQAFAKIIRNEFKELHHREMGAPEINSGKMNEERIIEQTLSVHLIDKTIAKITSVRNSISQEVFVSFNKKDIPQLFERVFYDIVKEELWDAWKEIDFATINGKTLKALIINKIKELKPEIFK
jgi:hypothetical protein